MEIREIEGKKAPQKHDTLYDFISNGQCSVRLYNVIFNNTDFLGITQIHGTKVKVVDLEGVSALNLLSCRNAGVATVKEFKELCAICGVMWVS